MTRRNFMTLALGAPLAASVPVVAAVEVVPTERLYRTKLRTVDGFDEYAITRNPITFKFCPAKPAKGAKPGNMECWKASFNVVRFERVPTEARLDEENELNAFFQRAYDYMHANPHASLDPIMTPSESERLTQKYRARKAYYDSLPKWEEPPVLQSPLADEIERRRKAFGA